MQRTTRRIGYIVLATPVMVMCAGCIIIPGSWGPPAIWTESVEETRALPSSGMDELAIRTHNGSIGVHGTEGQTSPSVSITKKTGGWTPGSAEAAMEALEVFVEPDGAGTVKIGWKWNVPKRPDWRARVNFDIQTPSHVKLDAHTHNGRLVVDGLDSEVHISTHNGRIKVDSTGGPLHAHTHNGRVIVKYSGEFVTLTTHNGRIEADLADCRAIEGKIRTHNGRIIVELGDDASFELASRTHNGTIRCETAITNAVLKRHRVSGTIGQGGGTLRVTTHNGGIRLAKKSG